MTAPPVRAADVVRRRRRRIALILVLGTATTTGLFLPRRLRHAVTSTNADSSAKKAVRPARVVPESVRIKVEVINATDTRGLGRLATAWLRDQGFDVVATGTAPEAERRDSTLVLIRSGHADWAALAATAMGGARVESRPDSLRYLDLTVLVGRSWRAPPQTLYP